MQHYSLEASFAVGFRVRSHRGTLRKWANARLSEYLVKGGFTMDDEPLKNHVRPEADHEDSGALVGQVMRQAAFTR